MAALMTAAVSSVAGVAVVKAVETVETEVLHLWPDGGKREYFSEPAAGVPALADILKGRDLYLPYQPRVDAMAAWEAGDLVLAVYTPYSNSPTLWRAYFKPEDWAECVAKAREVGESGDLVEIHALHRGASFPECELFRAHNPFLTEGGRLLGRGTHRREKFTSVE